MSSHLVIKDGACGEIVVKKSRFIAELKYVETEEEATNFIKEKKKQYHDARHNCSCYIIDEELKKSSDDGEPSGTAGRPMLEVLEGKDLINVVAVVTRYFGGVLLGTGGLVRAYQDAVKEALLNCDFLHTVVVNKVNVTLDYSIWPKIENYCKEKGVVVGEVEFAENVKAELKIQVDNTDKVIDDIIEITNGKGHIDKDDKEYTIFCD